MGARSRRLSEEGVVEQSAGAELLSSVLIVLEAKRNLIRLAVTLDAAQQAAAKELGLPV